MKLLLLLSLLLWAKPNSTGINWLPYKAALKKAKQEKKLLWINVHADWCKPCHLMSKTTYQDSIIVQTLKERFIPTEIDADISTPIPCDGKSLAPMNCLQEKWSPLGESAGLPMTVILGPNSQKSLLSLKGYIPPEEMQYFLQDLLSSYQGLLEHDAKSITP